MMQLRRAGAWENGRGINVVWREHSHETYVSVDNEHTLHDSSEFETRKKTVLTMPAASNGLAVIQTVSAQPDVSDTALEKTDGGTGPGPTGRRVSFVPNSDTTRSLNDEGPSHCLQR